MDDTRHQTFLVLPPIQFLLICCLKISVVLFLSVYVHQILSRPGRCLNEKYSFHVKVTMLQYFPIYLPWFLKGCFYHVICNKNTTKVYFIVEYINHGWNTFHHRLIFFSGMEKIIGSIYLKVWCVGYFN